MCHRCVCCSHDLFWRGRCRYVGYQGCRAWWWWRFATLIAAVAGALGTPLDAVLPGCRAGDIGLADGLLGMTRVAAAVVGDKGYDSDALIQAIAARAMAAVIGILTPAAT